MFSDWKDGRPLIIASINKPIQTCYRLSVSPCIISQRKRGFKESQGPGLNMTSTLKDKNRKRCGLVTVLL